MCVGKIRVCLCMRKCVSGCANMGFKCIHWWTYGDSWSLQVICSKLIIVEKILAECQAPRRLHFIHTASLKSLPRLLFSLYTYSSPLRLQPSCFHLMTLQLHFPYQSYWAHFDEHGRSDAPRGGLHILVASGFYSSSIFCGWYLVRGSDWVWWAGPANTKSTWMSTLDWYWYWSAGWRVVRHAESRRK